jgi:ribosomal protein S18 acetylase RimI-like enzyme
MIEPKKNIAEVAFSVNRQWQGKGIASVLLNKLAQAANSNGLSGLVAYTSPENRGMIQLFKKLPYKIHSIRDDGMTILSCRFDEPI